MINTLLTKLEKVQPRGHNQWLACCPAHEDKSPSLALKELSDGRILIHCFAGCEPSEVLSSVGLTMVDLFPEGALGEFKGWEALKKNTSSKPSEDNIVLSIANNRRKNGLRLSRQDLEREHEAFLRTR